MDSVSVTWYGQAGFRLAAGDSRVLIDPFLTDRPGPSRWPCLNPSAVRRRPAEPEPGHRDGPEPAQSLPSCHRDYQQRAVRSSPPDG
jgi:L-ascorbate metabolism protein UlaG (beta-lactamase superfamily)